MVVSQSMVGRTNAEKPHGLVGMLKNPYVFMTCAFASLGCIMYGYDQGVMSPVLVMENFQNHFPSLMGSTIQGWLVSALELGAWAGALFNGYLADRISRMQFVGGTTCNPEGITDPYLPDGSFDYDKAHGHTCLGQKSIAWRFPLALQILFAWILFFGMFLFPFSPRWLMSKHREEEAVVALSKLRRLDPNDPLIKAEVLEIKAAVMFDEESDREAVQRGGKLAPWKALFAPNMFKRLVLGCGMSSAFSLFLTDADAGREGMMICQQFTGINAVLYYAPQIFASFGFSSSKQTLLATGVTGILQIVFTMPAVLFLDKFGRKTFLIVGAAGMFCCHIVVATVEGLYEDDWALNEGLYKAQGWVAIAFIWLFAVNFAYSWGPVAWVLAQEIFPNSARSRGVSIVASTNWMFNFVIGLTTKDMLNSMKYGTYIFFAIFSALGGAFIWWFAPETKDKTLEELDIYFGGTQESITEADRARMARINEQLGLSGVEKVEDLIDEKGGAHDELREM
ncbi:hypothetical protein AN7938.2 [Aspergillus nidulans FGSC A4]|nr:hypothetical protein AN7938.2 [Aspergillus nidulans FGSC A4]|eukprot:XP_681207.1 hypothetical protein AN7938.2 [Aspergillus nidulans FGSC A4]